MHEQFTTAALLRCATLALALSEAGAARVPVRLFGGTEAGAGSGTASATAAAMTAEETAAQAELLLRYAWVFGVAGALVLALVSVNMYRSGPQLQVHQAAKSRCWPARRTRTSHRTAPELPLQLTTPVEQAAASEAVEREEPTGHGSSADALTAAEEAWLSGPTPTAAPAAAAPVAVAATTSTAANRRSSPSRKGRSKLVVKYDSSGAPRMMHSHNHRWDENAAAAAPSSPSRTHAPSGGLPPLRMGMNYAANGSNGASAGVGQRARRKLRMNADGSSVL